MEQTMTRKTYVANAAIDARNPLSSLGHRVPTVHLNGTAREDLLEQLSNAYDAIVEAEKTLSHATPNGRDYYLQEHGALELARRQHADRIRALSQIKQELEAIAIAVGDQP
jgi:hypothetical protein